MLADELTKLLLYIKFLNFIKQMQIEEIFVSQLDYKRV